MIELRMFSYNFAYMIMSDILYQRNQNKASIQRKSTNCYYQMKTAKPFRSSTITQIAANVLDKAL